MQNPSDFDVNLKYHCPKCGDDYWITLQEAKVPGFKIVCFCGGVILVKTVENVKLNIQFSASKTNEAIDKIQLTVVKMLGAAGYRLMEAKILVSKYYVQGMTANELFAKCCINAPTKPSY